MRTALFQTFPCGIGDCNFLLLKDNDGHEFHLMVDCGSSFTKKIRDYLENTFHKRLDLLVATHIDNDHISGLAKMLTSIPDLQIGQIIYNCYQQPQVVERCIDNKLHKLIDECKEELPPVVEENEYQISATGAILLAENIYGNKKWTEVWNREYVTNESSDWKLINDENYCFGKIVFLSPTQDALNNLDETYKKAFLEKFYKKKDEHFKDESNIFELLMLLKQLDESDIMLSETISSSDITSKCLRRVAEKEGKDSSVTNIASIAFVWEWDETRILFLGDAVPEVIVESIKKKYRDKLPLDVKAIKISHHGSVYNTTYELLDLVRTSNFVFTGGNQHDKPSESTIAKILTSDVGKKQIRNLHFNHKSSITECFVNAPKEIKTGLKFEADYNQTYVFEF